MSSEIRRVTLMLRAGDTARADIALTPERIYYRFATDESIEDGELLAPKDEFSELANRLIIAAAAKSGEGHLSEDMKVTIFVDNRLSDIKISEPSLRRLVAQLRNVAEEFIFLGGFC